MRSGGSIRLAGKALVEVMGGKTTRRLPMEQSAVQGMLLDLGLEEL